MQKKNAVCLISSILITFATISPALSDADCSTERSLRSASGVQPVPIEFRNMAASEEDSFRIYWIDYQGRRKFYKHLFKGQRFRIDTFMTHPWLITSPAPGGEEICVKIYLPKSRGRTVILR